MKVYIVFEGAYSSRGTRAVFSNEGEAKNYIENKRNRKADGSHDDYDDWDIETWEVNSTCPLITNRAMWRVDMHRGGEVEYVGREPNDKNTSRVIMQCYPETKGLKLLAYVQATDEKHAIKIVNEYRTQMIAMNEWAVTTA